MTTGMTMQRDFTGYIPLEVWERKWRKQVERAKYAIEVYRQTGDLQKLDLAERALDALLKMNPGANEAKTDEAQ